jgi:acetyl esterase/lipase
MAFEYKSIYLDSQIERGRALDIFEPENITSDIAVFFVHGGGWCAGSRIDYHELMQALNKEGYLCASAEYRLLADGITVAEQMTDIRQAYDEFVSFLKKSQRPLKIFVAGSSAGAHLAQLLAYADPGDCGDALEFNGRKLDNDWVKPVGVAPFCGPVTFEPWEDIFPGIWSAMQKIAGKTYSDAPELYKKYSPDAYIDKIACGVFFFCAQNEHMFPIPMVADFIEKLKSRGITAQYKVYSNCEHGFFYGLGRRQQREAFADLLEILKSL